MMTIAAGWFDDPENSEQLRWWDGQLWTSHFHPKAQATVQAPMAGAPDSAAHVQPASTAPILPKVPTFGAKRFAQELQQENLELRSAIETFAIGDAVEADRLRIQLNAHILTLQGELNGLHSQIASARSGLEQTSAHLINMRDQVNLQEFGLFDYAHPAEASVALATRLEYTRSQIKQMVRDGQATQATSNFTFNNSAAQGRKFVNSMSKLLLRAYNAEAENCVKSVRAGNLGTAQNRLSTAVDQIARQGTMINLHITPAFHSLRLTELEIAASHLQALQREKEQERAQREELREQRKAEQELKREQEKLEKEKAHYNATLAALIANGDEEGAARIRDRIADVEHALENVDYRVANIRAGYVCVISNAGAFGPGMVKIGMTRRLEPMDRVRELGDASVPFRFDVHALFFAQDAAGVEAALHRRFSDERVNRVNMRREFFRVAPEQVLAALQDDRIGIVEFNLEPQNTEFLASKPIFAG